MITIMSSVKLRNNIKKTIDHVPAERLDALADYVSYLARPSVTDRISRAEKAIAGGKGVGWRKVRRDV